MRLPLGSFNYFRVPCTHLEFEAGIAEISQGTLLFVFLGSEISLFLRNKVISLTCEKGRSPILGTRPSGQYVSKGSENLFLEFPENSPRTTNWNETNLSKNIPLCIRKIFFVNKNIFTDKNTNSGTSIDSFV